MHTLPDLLRHQARCIPDHALVHWRDTTLTYAEFDARTDALATGLANLGVAPGDVVSIYLPNCVEFLEAWWATLKAGGVFGPINAQFTGPEAAYVLAHSEAVAVVCNAEGAAIIERHRGELPALRHVICIEPGAGDITLDELRAGRASSPSLPSRSADDLAALVYTSGTTGKPKGAMLTHANYLADAAMTAELLPLARGDRLGMILPLFHVNAQLATFIVPIMVGCEVAMWERFSASSFWDTVAELQPVTISAVPTILATLLNAAGAERAENTSLRFVMCGAAPLSRELMQAFEEQFGLRILEGYGLTESTCVSSLNPYYGARKPGSIGLPLRGQEMRIVGRDGAPLADGEWGQIAVRGPNVMVGYFKNPEATAETIVDGWLLTGDVGHRDDDGYFFIVDRAKDMIIRGGENIYPREIEEVLYEHPAILEAAVIGVPDEIRGEEVLALLAPKAGAEIDEEQLREFVDERLAAFKAPSQYAVRPELPKTSTGKISKAELRSELATQNAAP